MAANNMTTIVLNGPLDRDSLVVDKTRFKWAEVSDQMLILQPFADLGSGERLVAKVNFKDRSVPVQAVFTLVTHATELDGTVEVDRRANTPEALIAALSQKEAELEELKARHAGSGPSSLVLSGWLYEKMKLPINFLTVMASADAASLEARGGVGYEGRTSALLAISIRNPQGQKPWAPGEARLLSASGEPVRVLSVQMKSPQLAPGEEGLIVVEAKTPPGFAGAPFRVALVDAAGERRLSFTLVKQK